MTFRKRLAQMIGHLGVLLLGAGILRGLFDYRPDDLSALYVVILAGVVNMLISAKWGE